MGHTNNKLKNLLEKIVEKDGFENISTKDLQEIGLPFELLLHGHKWTKHEAEEFLKEHWRNN